MKVADVMSSPARTVDQDTPVEQVARIMAEHHLSGLPVLDNSGRLIGMIGEEDLIVRNANLHLPTFLTVLDGLIPVRGQHEYDDEVRHMLATRAAEVMAEQLYTIDAEADVADAATIMIDKHVQALPVVHDRILTGIISRGDIVRLMASQDTAADRSSA